LIVKRNKAHRRSQLGRRFDNTLHRHRVPVVPRIESILHDSQVAENRPRDALHRRLESVARATSQQSQRENCKAK
jgi:hypothetical protein